MNSEDDEFNRIEREAAMRKEAVSATVEKRGWVGLTNDEVNNIAAGCNLGNSVQDAIFRAQAKLKEKNLP